MGVPLLFSHEFYILEAFNNNYYYTDEEESRTKLPGKGWSCSHPFFFTPTLHRFIYYQYIPITVPSTSWNSSWREFLYCNAPEAVHVVAILMMSESQPSSSIHFTEGYHGTASDGLRTHNNTDLDLMVACRGFRWIFSCRWLWGVYNNVSYSPVTIKLHKCNWLLLSRTK